ncbi:AAA family ATPase [Wolbachia endosymbiont (group A) of Anomoia purmunda]|uniref:hypothetical protein n=1 Tax=Wolbachia endosymbiont (group A) of Anomoia purmunda TaxID=2953978 RepID=UPI0022301CEB|nr:hypothetical protein [Wolbachia endosymbiont (group A) of Anomoia purmunda]
MKDEKEKLKIELERSTLRVVDRNVTIRELQGELDTLQDLDQQLKEKEKEIAQLKTQMTEAERKNKELEAKNKTIEQPKQGNGARYTAIVGMSSTAGLVAFIALKCTVRLDIWVMVGIAAVSAAVVGGITYAVLPSTQVDGAKAQEVDGNNKGK